MIWEAAGEIRRLPATVETFDYGPILKLHNAYFVHFFFFLCFFVSFLFESMVILM